MTRAYRIDESLISDTLKDKINDKASKVHIHSENDILNLDKYTRQETIDLINSRMQDLSDVPTTSLDALVQIAQLLSDNPDISSILSGLTSKVDKVEGKGLSTEDYTSGEKDKLQSIEVNANKYVHPGYHDPNIIKQDENNTFVSQTERQSWNVASSRAHLHENLDALDSVTLEFLNNMLSHLGNSTAHLTSGDKILISQISSKADSSDIVELREGKADRTDLEILSQEKADLNYVNNELTRKADMESMDVHVTDNAIHISNEDRVLINSISTKVDKQFVTSAIAGKADASTLEGHITNNSVHITQSEKTAILSQIELPRTYTHTQITPLDTWVITHPLLKKPSVTVVDSGGSQVTGDIHYDSDSQVTVRFIGAFSGQAFLN